VNCKSFSKATRAWSVASTAALPAHKVAQELAKKHGEDLLWIHRHRVRLAVIIHLEPKPSLCIEAVIAEDEVLLALVRLTVALPEAHQLLDHGGRVVAVANGPVVPRLPNEPLVANEGDVGEGLSLGDLVQDDVDAAVAGDGDGAVERAEVYAVHEGHRWLCHRR
jgi:hypothetical protein